MATRTPHPIVLIHGLWMTPRSWDTWAERFRACDDGWTGQV